MSFSRTNISWLGFIPYRGPANLDEWRQSWFERCLLHECGLLYSCVSLHFSSNQTILPFQTFWLAGFLPGHELWHLEWLLHVSLLRTLKVNELRVRKISWEGERHLASGLPKNVRLWVQAKSLDCNSHLRFSELELGWPPENPPPHPPHPPDTLQ